MPVPPASMSRLDVCRGVTVGWADKLFYMKVCGLGELHQLLYDATHPYTVILTKRDQAVSTDAPLQPLPHGAS